MGPAFTHETVARPAVLLDNCPQELRVVAVRIPSAGAYRLFDPLSIRELARPSGARRVGAGEEFDGQLRPERGHGRSHSCCVVPTARARASSSRARFWARRTTTSRVRAGSG